MVKTSLAKAREGRSVSPSGARPIMVIALAMTVGNSVKSLIVSEKALMIACSAGGRVSAGMIRILRESVKARRRVISVAKRV